MLKSGQYGVKLRFDTGLTPVDDILARLTDKGSVVDITISDPPLEQIIARIYEQAAADEVGASKGTA